MKAVWLHSSESKLNLKIWWHTPAIPVLEKQKQEDHKFEANMKI